MIKLLIVDDESIERDALKHIIRNSELEVGEFEEAFNGRDAVEKAISFQPDIIFMDIKMPGISGIEASKRIKGYLPDCKIVLLTAFDYFEYAKEAIKIGVEDFIIKPAANEQVIETLKRIIDKLNIENEYRKKQIEISSKLENVTKYFENELVSSLVVGEIDDEQIKEYFSVMNIDFKISTCLVLNIDFEKSDIQVSSQLQKDMIKKRCMEKLRSMIDKWEFKCLITHINDIIYILIFYTDDNIDKSIEDKSADLFNQIFVQLTQQLKVVIKLGIGDICNEMKDISICFRQAKIACRSEEENSGVKYYKDMKDDDAILKYPTEKEKKLFEKIIACDEDAALELVDEIFDWIIQSYNSLDKVSRKLYELLVVINREVMDDINSGYERTSRYFEELRWINTISESRAYLKQVIKDLIEDVKSIKIDRVGLLIETVCNYIKKNYSREITLIEMSEMVNLSSFYFSKMFKHYKNMKFIDYLTEIRINKAKELLKDPTINVKDIGEMIGYVDPNYFTRVFKRTEGITPTDYRNKKMLQKQ